MSTDKAQIPMPNKSAPLFSDAAKMLELLFTNTLEYFLLIDRQLRIQAFNKATYQQVKALLGVEIRVGLSVLDLAPPDRRFDLIKIYEQALQGNKMESETQLTINGAVLYLHNSYSPAQNENGDIVAVIVYSRDITEKRVKELEAKEQQDRWQFALEGSNLGLWDWNLQTDDMYFSDSYKRLYGFDKDELENRSSEWTSRIHPEDKPIILGAVKIHTASEDPYYETTYRLLDKGGNYRWVLSRGKIFTWDKSGQPLRMIGTHTDITQQKEAEEALRSSNERFQLAAKATSEALWEWDIEKDKVFTSPVYKDLFGFDIDPNANYDEWHDLIHPDDREETINGYYATIADPKKERWDKEYRYLRSDGDYAYVSDHCLILRNAAGKAVKVVGALQDITNRKKAEEEARKSRERFDIVIKATNDLIWDWDLESGSIYRDKEGLRKVYGVEDESTIVTFYNWLQRVHPDDHNQLESTVNEMMQNSAQSMFEAEYRFRRDDGEYNYIHDRGILLRDAEGKPIRLIGAAQDITDRKQLEHALLLKELNKQKVISQSTIETQERERGEIGKELHDNVNQILTTTKLYLELSLSNTELKDELIQKSSKNIIYVINEIRQLSRSLMNPSLGDLGVLDSLNDLIENVNLTKKLKVKLTAQEDIEDFLSDTQKLMIYRIVQETLNNAIRHSKAEKADIELIEKDSLVHLKITDNGVGFDPLNIKKGAGLNNIQNRVYLANGTIVVQSQPQKGCTISITFPTKKTAN